MVDLPSWQTSGHMAQRFHPVVEHASDDYAIAPIIEAPAEIVENMRCGTPPAGGELDMEGPDAVCKIIPLARARTLQVIGDHLDRPLNQLGIPLALQSTELPPGLSQDVHNVLCRGRGEPIFQDRLRG